MTFAAIANLIVTIAWVVIILYWIISAVGVKKNVSRTSSWWASFLLRVVFIIAVVIILDSGLLNGFWIEFNALPIFQNLVLQIIGVILTLGGIAFAIWARVHLGRNWSGTPSIKQDHELVTSGPYRFVRHPIYTGIGFGLLGSALVVGPAWLIAFIIFTIVFIFRIPVEEKYMMQLFPDQYPAYRRRTKALVPWVW
jgi:protein-S-isoprenylcysteine O-methyltransferase Ste14